MNNVSRYPQVLLMNPIEEGQDYVVDVDPVISRHTGGKTKIGMFPPLGMTSVAAVLRESGIPVHILDPIAEGYTFQEALRYAKSYEVIVINDRSTDGTGSVLARYLEEYSNLSVINVPYLV